MEGTNKQTQENLEVSFLIFFSFLCFYLLSWFVSCIDLCFIFLVFFLLSFMFVSCFLLVCSLIFFVKLSMLQTCQNLEWWKIFFLGPPKLIAKLLSAKSLLFLAVWSPAMTKLWKVKTKKLSTLQTLTLKFRSPRIFFLNSPKLGFKLRTTKSSKILVSKLQHQTLEQWKDFIFFTFKFL